MKPARSEVRDDGVYTTVGVNAYRIESSVPGAARRVIGFVKDVSEKVRAEEERHTRWLDAIAELAQEFRREPTRAAEPNCNGVIYGGSRSMNLPRYSGSGLPAVSGTNHGTIRPIT